MVRRTVVKFVMDVGPSEAIQNVTGALSPEVGRL